MVLGPFEMPDAQWALVLKLIRWKMQEEGISTPQEGLGLIKKFWVILNDPAQMETIDDQNTLNALIVLRDQQDTNRSDLDARIAALEAKLGL